MNYEVTKCFDHYKLTFLYRVVGVDNEYVGEWHISQPEAEKEYQGLQVSFENYEALPQSVQDLIMNFSDEQIGDDEFGEFLKALNALGYTAEYSMCGGVYNLAYCVGLENE